MKQRSAIGSRLSAMRNGVIGSAVLVAVAVDAAGAQTAQAPVRFTIRAADTVQAVADSVAPTARSGSTQAFDVEGVRVIVRTNPANDVVAANLYLLGGTRQLTQETQGIEALLLAASERGTRRYTRESLRRAMAQTASTITVDPDEDWTRVSLRTVRSALDSSWAVLADRVMAPTLAAADVELVRAQLLGAARQRVASPDAHVSHVADSVAFGAHPYALVPDGTEASLAAITLAQLKEYHAAQVVRSRMLLVVVGNVTRAQVEAMVRRSLARLPRGTYEWMPPPALPANTGVTVVSRALPTNYILGYYAGPAASSEDYAALRVASAVLGGSLFSEIRTRHNLTYAVDAPFIERAVATGGVYVTTVAPDTTLALMRRELELLKSATLAERPLQQLVQRFITDYFLRNETNADQANFLARAELYAGGFAAADRFVETLQRVTPEDVRRVAREYMKDFRFVYLGDPARVDAARMEGW